MNIVVIKILYTGNLIGLKFNVSLFTKLKDFCEYQNFEISF